MYAGRHTLNLKSSSSYTLLNTCCRKLEGKAVGRVTKVANSLPLIWAGAIDLNLLDT